jgi:hypothetical protein
VKVTLRSHKSKCPLEYADWEKVIAGIENKIALVCRKPVGSKRNMELTFYSEAVSHCRHIRDILDKSNIPHEKTLQPARGLRCHEQGGGLYEASDRESLLRKRV